MSVKNNYDAVQRILNRCMTILRQTRVDELDEIFEEREEFVQLSKQSSEVCEKLKDSLTEEQNDLFRQFIDIKVDMGTGKGLFYYKHGFEDCQALYQIFHELSEGKTLVPPLDENAIIDDWPMLVNSPESIVNPEDKNKCNGLELVLEISRRLDSILAKYIGEIEKC